MRHEIQVWPGDSSSVLIWDDEAGSVTLRNVNDPEGDIVYPSSDGADFLPTTLVDGEPTLGHPFTVCAVFQGLEPGGVVRFSGSEETYTLRDVRHNAADFLRLFFWGASANPDQLPASLRGVQPTLWNEPPDA